MNKISIRNKILFFADKALKTIQLTGIILSVHKDFALLSKGYVVYKFDYNNKLEEYARILDNNYSFLAKYKIFRRLLRMEITKYYHFKSGDFCISKKGIYKKMTNTKALYKCFTIIRGSRPLNICEDIHGNLYFGEYFNNVKKDEVVIYKSTDAGNSWHSVYVFPANEINHIHGIYSDPYSSRLWFLTGDHDNECIIGYSEDGFESIVEFLRGKQDYRACIMLFYPDYLVFGTDSPYIQNKIYKIDRETKKVSLLQNVSGSVIYGGQTHDFSYISTTVEPSKKNQHKLSELWISKEGVIWNKVYEQKKDLLPTTLFQFGSIRFPFISAASPFFSFSGRSLKKIDGKSIIVNKNDLI